MQKDRRYTASGESCGLRLGSGVSFLVFRGAIAPSSNAGDGGGALLNVSGGGGGLSAGGAVSRRPDRRKPRTAHRLHAFLGLETLSVLLVVQTQNDEQQEISNGANDGAGKGGTSAGLESATQTRSHAINAVPERLRRR